MTGGVGQPGRRGPSARYGAAVMQQEESPHTPVLLDEVLKLLAPAPGEVVLDATIGAAGHAVALADRMGASGLLIGLDVDSAILDAARGHLADVPCRVELRQESFREARQVIDSLGVTAVDVLLADLGVSSAHLDRPERGFSFRQDGPLDMRMDQRLATTAADLVNSLAESELASVLFRLGEERKSRTIARAICRRRVEQRIETTAALSEIVCRALRVDPRSRRSRIHPATKTFQALRIAVNDELGALEDLLEAAPEILAAGGRFGVIAFHSLEDRLVKRSFREGARIGAYSIRTKKPVTAGEAERLRNPRSRSAKLRVVERLRSDIGAPVST